MKKTWAVQEIDVRKRARLEGRLDGALMATIFWLLVFSFFLKN